MKKFFVVMIALSALILPSCVYDSNYGPSYPSRPIPNLGSGQGSGYYQRGLNQGASDARKGYPNNVNRYLSGLPRAFRSDFSRGYRDGYRQPPHHGGNNHGDRAKYYQKGIDHGSYDVRKGRSYNTTRYIKGIPREYRSEYTRGYQTGFRQTHHSAGGFGGSGNYRR